MYWPEYAGIQEGLYNCTITLSRPKAGLARTRGVARDKRIETHSIRALSARDAVNQAASLSWERMGPKGWDVTATFTYAGERTTRRIKHSLEV